MIYRISSSQSVRDERTSRNWSQSSAETTTYRLALIQVTINVWKIAWARRPPKNKISFFLLNLFSIQLLKPGGLDLSRRDLDRDLDLDTEKKLVSTVEKISTVSKS